MQSASARPLILLTADAICLHETPHSLAHVRRQEEAEGTVQHQDRVLGLHVPQLCIHEVDLLPELFPKYTLLLLPLPATQA